MRKSIIMFAFVIATMSFVSCKEEAKEAYEMQLPFKVAGAVGNVFKGISDAVAPARAYELAIRAQTPGLIAQTYANNPFANRKWIS